MSSGSSPNSWDWRNGVQGPSSLWRTMSSGGAQCSARVPVQGTTSGGDHSAATQVVRSTLAQLRLARNQCVDLNALIAPVIRLMQDPAIKSILASTDLFQELYGEVVVKVAESYLSVREDKGKDGRANNTGREVEEFQKNVKSSKGAAWCAAFAYTCHMKAATMLGGVTTAPRDAAACQMWYRSKNTNIRFTSQSVLAGLNTPRAGDLFVFEEVEDTAAKAKKDRDKDVKTAELQHQARVSSARKSGAEGEGLEKIRRDSQERLDDSVKDADEKLKERTKDMKHGVKLGDKLSRDTGTHFSGHTGIVKSCEPLSKKTVTIEGNTNAGGSREGDGVYEKTDRMDRRKDGSMSYPQLYGFVRPKYVPLTRR